MEACQTLPQPKGSLVAVAALAGAFRYDAVVYPSGLNRSSRSEQRTQQRKTALDPHHTALLQDCHAACNAVMVLERDTDYDRFKKAEDLELEKAHSGWKPCDGSLPPRPDLVTIIYYQAEVSANAIQLLDAAQFLAREPDVEGHRAAQTTRMAFLAGSTGRRYVQGVFGSLINGERKTFFDSGCNACIVLGWWQDDELRHSLIPIPYYDTAGEYANAIRNLVAKRWDERCYYPTGRLARRYPDVSNAQNAYVNGVIDCAQDFFKYTRAASHVQLSPYASTSPQYVGFLQFSGVYVRIVPRELSRTCKDGEAQLTDAAVLPGLLLCQKGWRDDANAMCKRARQEEVNNTNRPDAVYGLREPRDQQETVTSLHVLYVHVERVDLGTAVTSFGIKAAPAQNLGASMWRMQRRIVPLDETLLSKAFVLPTTRTCCEPPQSNLHKPMFFALEDTVDEFEAYFQTVGSREKKRTREELKARNEVEEGPPTPRIRVMTPTPTVEETQTMHAFGMHLSQPAVRLGDACSALAQRDGSSPLTAFFSAMAAQVGPDESVTVGFQHAVDIYHKTEQRDRITKEEIQSLNNEIQTLKSATDTTSTTSTEPVHEPDHLTAKGIATLMKGIGREASKSTTLAFPLTSKIVGKMVTLLSQWPGLDSEAAGKAKDDCKRIGTEATHTTILNAMSAVFGTLLSKAGGATTTRVLLLYETVALNNDDTTHSTATNPSFDVYKLVPNTDPTLVSAAHILNSDLSTTPVLVYSENSGKLIYYASVAV